MSVQGLSSEARQQAEDVAISVDESLTRFHHPDCGKCSADAQILPRHVAKHQLGYKPAECLQGGSE